jgi:hypothetical protein
MLEEEYYHVTAFGLHHLSTLTTPALLELIEALICRDWFRISTNDTHFDIEIHLRCVITSLRLLSARGVNRGSGKLRFEVFDKLYSRMRIWQNCHNGQCIKNHNNEFLIVYAQDLIASFPNDRTFAANIVSRAIATAEVVGHAV